MTDIKVLKVSSATPTKQLAGCLATCVENNERVELRAVGASAVNQMLKAVAITNGIVASKGYTVLVRPCFDDFEENGETKTAIIAKVVVQ